MWKYADSSKGPKKDKYSTQAINKALKKDGHTSMAEQFANYSAATRYTHPDLRRGRGAQLPGQAARRRRPPWRPKKKKTFKAKLDHLSSATFQFVPQRDDEAQAALRHGAEVHRLPSRRDHLSAPTAR